MNDPSVVEQNLKKTVREIIQEYAIENDVRPSKIAQIAKISTHITHQLASPSWNPSLRSLNRLYEVLPAGYQAKFASRYASRGPLEIRLPYDDAAVQFDIVNHMHSIRVDTNKMLETAIEIALERTDKFILYRMDRDDFIAETVAPGAHLEWPSGFAPGQRLTEHSEGVWAGFTRSRLHTAIATSSPVFALAQRPIPGDETHVCFTFYTLRVPFQTETNVFCFSFFTELKQVSHREPAAPAA